MWDLPELDLFQLDASSSWMAADIMLTSVHLACRILGHVAFIYKMLARHGTVEFVPYNHTHSAESLAGEIKAAVEAKTGLPLDSFRH